MDDIQALAAAATAYHTAAVAFEAAKTAQQVARTVALQREAELVTAKQALDAAIADWRNNH